jgi:hypothetical protein
MIAIRGKSYFLGRRLSAGITMPSYQFTRRRVSEGFFESMLLRHAAQQHQRSVTLRPLAAAAQ